jgi:hypothetical protein
MRYTLIIMLKGSYVYKVTSQATYNFNPKDNKLTRVSGDPPDSWMLNLIKQKNGVYLTSNPISDASLFLLIPESHPIFNAPCIEYIDLELVFRERISSFLKSVSEGIVKELLNN